MSDAAPPRRRGNKHRASGAWKAQLKEDAIERVKANRVAILSRARTGSDARGGVKEALQEILEDEISRAKRRRTNDDEGGAEDAEDAAARPSSVAGVETPSQGGDASGARVGAQGEREDDEDEDDDEMWADATPPRRSRSRSRSRNGNGATTWQETIETLSEVEYESLMLAMHASIEADLQKEEAAMLAEELERAEEEQSRELRDAADCFDEWQLDCAAAARADDPVVLCPVCKSRRLMRSSGNIFCGCGGLRLSLNASGGVVGAGGGGGEVGLALLQSRLDQCYERHGGGDCRCRELSFAVVDKFGIEALYAECRECAFLEAVI